MRTLGALFRGLARSFKRPQSVEKSRFTLEVPVKAPFIVEVVADLPYYLPLPDGVTLKPSLIGAEQFFVSLTKIHPKRHPEESQGTNVDDRRGTFVRSQARVVFPRQDPPPDDAREDYEAKAKSITNRLIESIRYVGFDHTIRPVEAFEKTVYRAWQLAHDGTAHPFGTWAEGSSFGPFGLTPTRELSGEALQTLWFVFNGLSPTNPAWHLVLDARYHNEIGDIPRAILDLGTALEISVPRMVELFAYSRPTLSAIDLDGPGIFGLYDQVLREATGHSLHEEPELFAKLEYIRALRNSVAHDWTPVFKITPTMEKTSRYLKVHRPREGHRVQTKEGVSELIEDASTIIKHTISLFESAVEP